MIWLMTTSIDRSASIEKLRDMVKNINFCMMTTIDEGQLRSRPMALNGNVEFDGDLWFFTYGSSHKVDEVNRHEEVNVSFSDPSQQLYVSMSGTAELVRDQAKIAELWEPKLKAWFPKELDEPDIALLKVSVTQAEYWDAPSGFVAHTIGVVKAALTGEPASSGKNEKLSL